MSERTSKNPGIADYVVARRKHKDCFLDEIDRLIDWKPLEKLLRNVKGGEKVYRLAGAKVYHPLSEKGPRGALSVDLISRFFTLGKALDFVRYPQEMVFEPDEASFCFG